MNCPDSTIPEFLPTPPDAVVHVRRAERVLGVTHGFMDERPTVLVRTKGDGRTLYVARWGGEDMVLGCTCHHEVVDYRDGPNTWRVMVFDIEPVVP